MPAQFSRQKLPGIEVLKLMAEKMKILIVGGGVAGTALAGFIQNYAEITVIDKTPKWGDIGYAIALWGNGRKVLRELGAEHDVVKEGYEILWDALEDTKGNLLKDFNFSLFAKYGPTIVVTRTTLHRALIKTLKNVNVRLGTTVKEIIQDDKGATVTFSDGTKEFFDLVVGADGIHSQIREMVFGKEFVKYYGWTVWAFWTPKGMASPRGAIEISGGGRIYFVYPMEDRAVVMLAAAIPPTIVEKPEERREFLKKLFGDFKESVGHMIDAIEDPAHIFRDNLMHIDMEKWYKGRVVLMGDAQHATSPITGMGASMALEDAFVLADELKKVDTIRIPLALENYAKRRHERVHKFRQGSAIVENWITVKSPILAMLRDVFIRIIPTRYFLSAIENLLKQDI